jgi:hypothetical protein
LAHVNYGPLSLPGDFNGDGVLTAVDIDLLTTEIKAGANRPTFDLNGDALVNAADHRVWVKDLKFTWFGDADLNGQFDSSDFIQVFVVGEYEDSLAMNSTWAEGDWNADQDFGSGDFVTAFQDGGYERGPRLLVASAVPEPASFGIFWIGIVGVYLAFRRSRIYLVSVAEEIQVGGPCRASH